MPALFPGPTYARLCDASGAAAIDSNHFVAASDEPQSGGENRLKLYRLGEREPVFRLDLNAHLQIEGDKPEADIEGAARVEDLIWWVTSHGRNFKGKARPNRQRLFATRIEGEKLVPVGASYPHLLEDLTLLEPLLARVDEEKRAPENGGISIEGLAQGQGDELWLGLRSPLQNDRALVVPILNPGEILRGERAVLAPAFFLDLGGRGIRDWDKLASEKWLILTGTSGDGDDFALFEWSGKPDQKPVELLNFTRELQKLGFKDFHPESFFETSESELRVLSDDGDLELPGGRNKDLPDEQREFRSLIVRLDENRLDENRLDESRVD